jgi:phosphatidylserine/phosphatidylglycerophosphate/cardiolipin synthase-like enzyme
VTVTPKERTVRSSGVTGVRVDPIITAVLLGELFAPNDELWLVSPWISDVPVLDNTQGALDAIIADAVARDYSLSETLVMIAAAGASLTVVTRPDEHNAPFVEAVRAAARIVEHPDVHEKTFCGSTWLLTGSMNFTLRGLQLNDEAMSYRLDAAEAALARVDFRRRWGGV